MLKSVELFEHMDESLHGKYFARQDVDTASVLFPWDYLSKEGQEAIREMQGRDGDYEETSAVVKLPGGVALSPSETEAILIGAYALADGEIDKLLDAVHPDPSSAGAETREEIR